MKYGDVDLGQIEAAINKLGGKEGLRKLLAGETKVVPISGAMRPAKKQSVLVRDGSFSSGTLTKRFDPCGFYRDRQGLYVWSDFSTQVLPAANPVEAGVGFKKTSSWKLKQIATGNDLLAERPKDVWSATDFCAWLSVKLAQQPNGEAGELLNTGYSNLFLVKGVNASVFVVSVYWLSIRRKWSVNAWHLGCGWSAGRRFVFQNSLCFLSHFKRESFY